MCLIMQVVLLSLKYAPLFSSQLCSVFFFYYSKVTCYTVLFISLIFVENPTLGYLVLSFDILYVIFVFLLILAVVVFILWNKVSRRSIAWLFKLFWLVGYFLIFLALLRFFFLTPYVIGVFIYKGLAKISLRLPLQLWRFNFSEFSQDQLFSYIKCSHLFLDTYLCLLFLFIFILFLMIFSRPIRVYSRRLFVVFFLSISYISLQIHIFLAYQSFIWELFINTLFVLLILALSVLYLVGARGGIFQQILVECRLAPLTLAALTELRNYLTRLIGATIFQLFLIGIRIIFTFYGGSYYSHLMCQDFYIKLFWDIGSFIVWCGVFISLLCQFSIVYPASFISLVRKLPGWLLCYIFLFFISPLTYLFVRFCSIYPLDLFSFGWFAKAIIIILILCSILTLMSSLIHSKNFKEYIGASIVFFLNVFVMTTICYSQSWGLAPPFFFISIYFIIWLHLLFLLLTNLTVCILINENEDMCFRNLWGLYYNSNFMSLFFCIVCMLVFLVICGAAVGWHFIFSECFLWVKCYGTGYLWIVFIYNMCWFVYILGLLRFLVIFLIPYNMSILFFLKSYISSFHTAKLAFIVPKSYMRIYSLLLWMGVWFFFVPGVPVL